MFRVASRFIILTISTLVFSCTLRDGKIKPDQIWFDYQISGDEESGEVVVRLQYRFASSNGGSFLPGDSSKTELDGIELKPDSSRMSGVYYETIKPVKEFAGRHKIVFTDSRKNKYTEEFIFRPFRIQTSMPSSIGRGDFTFHLDGVAPNDRINVIITDTASFSEGIDRIDTISDGNIRVSSHELSTLAKGPIFVQLIREEETPVRNGTKKRGRVYIAYTLKKELELTD
jgi:hypothetical protein